MQTRNENHAMQPLAVVLGAGAIACAIARRVAIGQHLLLADVKPENAEAAAQTLRAAGFACSTAQVNVAERASVQALAERAATLGSIRAVIHTAGLSPSQAAPQDILCIGSDNIGEDKWGTELDMAKQFVAAINRHGGDATLVHLPEIGITGNSHFLMGEKNNRQLADLAAQWLQEKGLDK